MIPVQQQPEPINFVKDVKGPGEAFLRNNPRATNKQIKKKNYWKECLPDLKKAYSEVCAYSATWIPATGSVDHFVPVSVKSSLAYDWSNYRLAMPKINNYKSSSTSVLDPFHIQPDWFVLDFSSFFIEAGNVPEKVKREVEMTVSILRLNTDDELVQQRFSMVQEYKSGDVSIDFLKRKYPFIAHEIIRQGITK